MRLVRRNRSLVLSASAVLLALVLGLGAALVQRNEARTQRTEADRQRALALQEADRVNQLSRQQLLLIAELRQQLEKKGDDEQQFRASLRQVLSDFELSLRADEARSGSSRGGEPLALGSSLSLARQYYALARMFGLSGDSNGAQRARQECVSILERAQKAGDGSKETLSLFDNCRAGLTKPLVRQNTQ
jgi:hypothetical protein